MSKTFLSVALFFGVIFFPSLAFADIGIPMIFITFPSMLVALVPIILVEAAVYKKSFEIAYKNALMPSFASNLVSTIVGVPLAWALLLSIELLTTQGRSLGIATLLDKIIAVIVQAGWLVPYEEELYWMIPIAAIVGFIPAFFISVFIEYHIVKIFFKSFDRTKIKRAVWKANIITYIILSFLLVLFLEMFHRISHIR